MLGAPTAMNRMTPRLGIRAVVGTPGSTVAVGLLALVAATSGCQTTAMSVEEAKRVTATFGPQAPTPPPRSA